MVVITLNLKAKNCNNFCKYSFACVIATISMK